MAGKKIYILIVVYLFFLILNAGASTVSFFVIETGVNPDGRNFNHSFLWENALLDVFFEAGYIVSNDDMLRMQRKPYDLLSVIDLDSLMMVGVDYLIIAQLDYSGEIQVPQEIMLFVYKINPPEKLFQSLVTERPGNDINDIKSITRGLINHVR
jgi:hypothetical protein